MAACCASNRLTSAKRDPAPPDPDLTRSRVPPCAVGCPDLVSRGEVVCRMRRSEWAAGNADEVAIAALGTTRSRGAPQVSWCAAAGPGTRKRSRARQVRGTPRRSRLSVETGCRRPHLASPGLPRPGRPRALRPRLGAGSWRSPYHRRPPVHQAERGRYEPHHAKYEPDHGRPHQLRWTPARSSGLPQRRSARTKSATHRRSAGRRELGSAAGSAHGRTTPHLPPRKTTGPPMLASGCFCGSGTR